MASIAQNGAYAYMAAHVDPLLASLLSALIVHRPTDVKGFLIAHLGGVLPVGAAAAGAGGAAAATGALPAAAAAGAAAGAAAPAAPRCSAGGSFLERLRVLFDSMDSAAAGAISRAALVRVLRERPDVGALLRLPADVVAGDPAFERVFAAIDTNCSDDVTFTEFTAYVVSNAATEWASLFEDDAGGGASPGGGAHVKAAAAAAAAAASAAAAAAAPRAGAGNFMQRLRELFGAIDPDGSGVITREKLIAALRERPDVAMLLRLPSYVRQVDGAPSTAFEHVFRAIDTDFSNEISFTEFLACVRCATARTHTHTHTRTRTRRHTHTHTHTTTTTRTTNNKQLYTHRHNHNHTCRSTSLNTHAHTCVSTFAPGPAVFTAIADGTSPARGGGGT